VADSLTDCLARAAAARAAANAEPLENARERHLASAKVWEDIAARVRQTAENRAKRDGVATTLEDT